MTESLVLNRVKLSLDEFNDIVDKFSESILNKEDKSISIGLIGDLGTGKTAFSKRLLKNVGVEELVKSPTFTYMVEYEAPVFDVYHFDAYRVSSSEDLYSIGYFDYIEIPSTIVIVEWANLIIDDMPENTIYFEIEHDSLNTRYYSAYIHTTKGREYIDIYNYDFN